MPILQISQYGLEPGPYFPSLGTVAPGVSAKVMPQPNLLPDPIQQCFLNWSNSIFLMLRGTEKSERIKFHACTIPQLCSLGIFLPTMFAC